MIYLFSGIALCFLGVVVFVDATHTRDAVSMLGAYLISGAFLMGGLPLFIKGVKRV